LPRKRRIELQETLAVQLEMMKRRNNEAEEKKVGRITMMHI